MGQMGASDDRICLVLCFLSLLSGLALFNGGRRAALYAQNQEVVQET